MTRADLEARLDAAPHDAAAFLVYADLLLESGEAHGELIRLQHQQALSPDDEALEARELELRRQLMPEVMVHAGRWELGFLRQLELMWINAESFAALSRALRSPLGRFVESVHLSDYLLPEDQEALADLLRELPRLEEVVLSANLELVRGVTVITRQLLQIAGRGGERLRRLVVDARSVAELLTELPAFPRLERLVLRGTQLRAEDADALALARPRLPQTCALVLEGGNCSLTLEERVRPLLITDSGPGLLVEEPAEHRGRWLCAAKAFRAYRIGAHFACELSLEGCGLGAVAKILERDRTQAMVRDAGDLSTPARALSEGDRLELGDVVLRYCDDVVAARSALRRL